MTGFLDDRIDDPAGEPAAVPPRPAPSRPSSTRSVVRAVLFTLLVAVIAGAAAYVISDGLPSRYESTAKLLLVPASRGDEPGQPFGNDAERIATTQRDVITSFSILQPVADQLGIRRVQDLRRDVSVEIPGNSDVLSLTVSDSSPDRAQDLVTAIIASYQEFLAGRGQATQVGFRLLDGGLVPEDPAAPRPVLNAAVAVVLTLVLGAALSFLLLHRRRRP